MAGAVGRAGGEAVRRSGVATYSRAWLSNYEKIRIDQSTKRIVDWIMHTLKRVLLFMPLLATPVRAQAPTALTVERWRADLRFLASELPKRHRNLFHKNSKATFDSAVASLDARIPALSDHEVVVGLAEIVALAGDGHTRMALPQDWSVGFDRAHTPTDPPSDSGLIMHHLPVRFGLFDDGLYIKEATPPYRDLIGQQVLRVGKLSADSAIEAMRPLSNYDNEAGFKFIAPTFLPVPEVLHALGLAPDDRSVTIIVRSTSGQQHDVVLKPIELFNHPEFIGTRSYSKPYDLRVIGRTLVVMYNEVTNDPHENIVDFAQRVRRTVRDGMIDKLVIDLRHNPGGDGNLARPIYAGLVRDSSINRFGHLYVLMGRETFSAAQFLLNDLEHSSNALFVGEASGGSPSSYGDSRKFKLPNSGLTVRASTIYWRDMDSDENRAATTPDIPVPYNASDFFANRDAGMAAVLAFNPHSAQELVTRIKNMTNADQAYRICWAYAVDPFLTYDERLAGASACGADPITNFVKARQ